MKTTITTIVGVVALFVLGACSSSEHQSMSPGGANATTHGTAKTGMPTGPDSGR